MKAGVTDLVFGETSPNTRRLVESTCVCSVLFTGGAYPSFVDRSVGEAMMRVRADAISGVDGS